MKKSRDRNDTFKMCPWKCIQSENKEQTREDYVGCNTECDIKKNRK